MTITDILLGTAQGAEGGGMSTILMFGAIFLVMYFFMIRPQSKKNKDQKNFLNSLEKGDKVVTSGGIHGKVLKVSDNTLLIEVDQNVKIKVEKSMISNDLSQAVNKESDETSDKKSGNNVEDLKSSNKKKKVKEVGADEMLEEGSNT